MMALADSTSLDPASSLLCAQELTDKELIELREKLFKKTVEELNALVKSTTVKLAGNSAEFSGISYITDEVKACLKPMPSFEIVKTEWKKKLKGILHDFTFMNLLIYLVYGRINLDMQSLKAFKSLKAYNFFYDEFVKNVWVYECPQIICANGVSMRVLYF